MKRSGGVLAAIGLVAASCGGGSASDGNFFVPADGATPTEATSPPADTAESASGSDPGPRVATSLEEVRPAVVRIVGTGTFAMPEDGEHASAPGSGSGFIVDPAGIAVTNNHVVTGAGLIEVYVGDDLEPRGARVLGVSECSDLAVIEIDGEGYDSLAWADSSAAAGSEVHAVGFSLETSEYHVGDGVISDVQAARADSLASVEDVVGHTADTLPGSTGGPLVGSDGRVVAVNYAGNGDGQSFAIGLDAARPVVATLATGVDHESIGVNGAAISDGTASGIRVSSVKSGSPAETAGIRPGDVLTSMQDVMLAEDGTMAAYCDVLRSHSTTDVIDISVYRAETNEALEGQLNGRALEVVGGLVLEPPDDSVQPGDGAPGDEVADEIDADVPDADVPDADVPDADVPVPDVDADVPADQGGLPLGTAYTEYVSITDDSNQIEMSVPVEWSDIDGRRWESDLSTGVDELIGPALTASPNIGGIDNRETWGTPGVFLGASAYIEWIPEQILDYKNYDDVCTHDGRLVYDDGLYTGWYDQYINCGAEGGEFMVAVVQPSDRIWTALLQITLVTEADRAAATNIIETFIIQPLAE